MLKKMYYNIIIRTQLGYFIFCDIVAVVNRMAPSKEFEQLLIPAEEGCCLGKESRAVCKG